MKPYVRWKTVLGELRVRVRFPDGSSYAVACTEGCNTSIAVLAVSRITQDARLREDLNAGLRISFVHDYERRFCANVWRESC